jgi:hypothetical protein
MSTAIHFMLLSSAPGITGMLTLRFASRPRPAGRPGFGFSRGIAFALAGLYLMLPIAIWVGSLSGQHPKHQPQVSPTEIFLLVGYLDVMFLWFIWSLNSCIFQPTESDDNPWEENWGASYSPELKMYLIDSVFKRLDTEGKLGNLIVDIGSGASPVSKLMHSTPDRRFIFIDVAGRNWVSLDTQRIRLDAENITRPDLLSYGKALIRVCRFLNTEPRAQAREERATAMVFSDILNYVDYRNVVSGFANFLKSGGRIIIINHPTRGIRGRFSEKGLKKNDGFYAFLEEQNLEIESKDFPCRPDGETDESEEMIVLVARKTAQQSASVPANKSHHIQVRQAGQN